MSAWIRETSRWAIFLRDDLECVYCRGRLIDLVKAKAENHMTLDHVTPRKAGGTHAPANLVSACYACNLEKHRKGLMVWCRDHAQPTETLRSRIYVRRRRPIEQYRAAARVLLGHFPGIPRAEIVDAHAMLVRSQYEKSIAVEWWQSQAEFTAF